MTQDSRISQTVRGSGSAMALSDKEMEGIAYRSGRAGALWKRMVSKQAGKQLLYLCQYWE